MQTYQTLSIEGMHCGACVRRVTAAIENIEGVMADSIVVGSADIRIDSEKASVEQVIAALEKVGFHAAAGR